MCSVSCRNSSHAVQYAWRQCGHSKPTSWSSASPQPKQWCAAGWPSSSSPVARRGAAAGASGGGGARATCGHRAGSGRESCVRGASVGCRLGVGVTVEEAGSGEPQGKARVRAGGGAHADLCEDGQGEEVVVGLGEVDGRHEAQAADGADGGDLGVRRGALRARVARLVRVRVRVRV